MTTGEQTPNRQVEPRTPASELWEYLNVLTILGIALGVVAGLYAVKVHKVIEDEQTLLLAMAGAAVAILAVVLTATALMAGLLQGFFGLIVHTGDGLRKFFLPIRIVSGVSAAAALAGFTGAINADSGPKVVKAALFGLTSGLTTWSILGAVWVTTIFIRYAIKQRERLTKQELEEADLEEIRRRAEPDIPTLVQELLRALRRR